MCTSSNIMLCRARCSNSSGIDSPMVSRKFQFFFKGLNLYQPSSYGFLIMFVFFTLQMNLMVEVGVSESFQQLRNDTRFWLSDSGVETRVVILMSKRETRLVILMSIDTIAKKVKIERWEDVASIRSAHHG